MIADSLEPFAVGTRLGHFVIVGHIGAGGMGEVYEAEDTKLHRHVALKVVRRDVAADPVRRARLEREASAVAKLNHPNIVTVHSLDEHEGVLFITMELISGSTLAAALPARGFGLQQVMGIAVQLADALSAAHALGIVHRDLKPSNIMMSGDGAIKVLDFGLSRLAVDPEGGVVPAETLTLDGSLLGTVPYMSPEQIEGQGADARSDLFSFGVVLFEAATGQRPFGGRTALATLTSIVKDPAPNASEISADVPDELARVIDRCLVKDRSRRTQTALDLRHQLEDMVRSFEADRWRTPPRRSPRLPRLSTGALRPALAAAGIVALAAAGWFAGGRRPAASSDARVTRFGVPVPADTTIVAEFNPHIAFSRDGTQLAVSTLPGPVSIRRLDTLEYRAVEASATPGFRSAPLFSPDGSMVAYVQGNAIVSSTRRFYAAALSGGAATTLADYDAFYKGDWSDDGWIYWTDRYAGGIVRSPERGGGVEQVTQLDAHLGDRSHRFATLLPDGHTLIYTVGVAGLGSYDDARIDLWDMRTRTRKTLLTGGTSAVYSSGRIIYARAGKLLAVPFDLSRREVTGNPFEVLDGVLMSTNTGEAEFSISRRGDLAFVPGRAVDGHRTLVWVDRSGVSKPLPLPPASYLYPRLSPDGRFLAVEIEGPNHDLYVYDFARSVLTKMTTDGLSHDPVWTPDAKRLVFRSWVSGGMTMWVMPVDRSAPARRLDPTGTRQSPVSVSPDGRFVSFDQKDTQTGDDAWVLPLEGEERPQVVARSRFDEGSAKFSPDGRWIAYASEESGRPEVYVQAFPGPGPKVQVSNAGGFDPVWKRTGGELYYRTEKGIMAVTIATTPRLQLSTPKQLWEGAYSDGAGSSCGMPGITSSNYDVTSDGQRFLMVRDDDSSFGANRVVVVLNWTEELKAIARRVPGSAPRAARVN